VRIDTKQKNGIILFNTSFLREKNVIGRLEEGIKLLGWPEVLLIFVVLLFIFGPKKLPQLAKDLGKAWQEFKAASSGITEAVVSPTTLKSEGTERKALVNIAEKMGIDTKGKTIEQVINDIEMNAENKGEADLKTAKEV
jgi:sec-independent protein translocase protein TatA